MTRERLAFFRARIAPNQYGPWWIELLEAAEAGLRDSERLDKLQDYCDEHPFGVSLQGPGCIRAAIDALPPVSSEGSNSVKPALCDSGLGDGKRGGK